jgi:hypothetical protein
LNSAFLVDFKNIHISDTIFYKPIEPLEVLYLLNVIKNVIYFSKNSISNYILKRTANSIGVPLSKICIIFISKGEFSKSFKELIVIRTIVIRIVLFIEIVIKKKR